MVNVLNFLKKLLLLILAIFDIIFMNCIFSSAKDIYLNFRIKHVLSIFYQPDNYMTSHDVPLSSTDISIFPPEINNFCNIEENG